MVLSCAGYSHRNRRRRRTPSIKPRALPATPNIRSNPLRTGIKSTHSFRVRGTYSGDFSSCQESICSTVHGKEQAVGVASHFKEMPYFSALTLDLGEFSRASDTLRARPG